MPAPNSKPNLTNDQRNSIAQWLHQHSSDGSLRHGAKKEAASLFNVDVSTIFRIWRAAASQQAVGRAIHLQSKKKGVKHKDRQVLDVEKVKNMSVLERSSLRLMSSKLGVSKSLIHRWVKEKKLLPHTNAVKPYLTPKNMLCRLRWSLSQLTPISEGGKFKFQPMYNTIHVDEKWFNLTQVSGRYYLLPHEIEPHRTCKSKRFIEKIMFLSVVSRPLIDSHGTVLFDGKFGIFPFTMQQPALRNSKNRVKGTMETKPVQAITQVVMKDCFINWMIPIIKAKWPEGANRHIFIQQDNAKPHIKMDDPDFIKAATLDGFNIKLICQPSNSSDTNVNDLGFFRSIQSIKNEKPASCVEELITNVKTAFEEYEPAKLNNVFLTLQGCYHEIIKVKGNNNYKIPHMNKERLQRLDILPECLEVDDKLVEESLDYLFSQETSEDSRIAAEEISEGVQQLYLWE